MAKVEVRMPKMGESITEGTVVEWHKKPGDAIELDESLLEIGTDKVDTDVPSPGAGTVSEILVEEGETVDVGTLIAIIETDGEAGDGVATEAEDVQVTEAITGDDAAAVVQEAEPAAELPSAGVAASGATVDVVMPKMGESITEGTIVQWHKQPGDSIELDEPLLEIGTDKVDTDVPSLSAGTVTELLAEEGDTVDVGTVIAVIATGGAAPVAQAVPEVPQPSVAEEPVPSVYEPAQPTAQTAVSAPKVAAEAVSRTAEGSRFYSPLVRSIARQEGLSESELASIAGSGRDGRVTKKDILAYLDNRGAVPAPDAPAPMAPRKAVLSPQAPVPAATPGDRVEVVKMDRMRQMIAEHMTRSKATSAHVTSFGEADVTNLVRLRERNKHAFLQREGVKLTYTPFFVFAAVQALREHPLLNSSIVGDEIHTHKDYHIGIAVAIGKTGLVVPVIHHAGQKNIVGLAHTAADLADRTRNKQLLPDELQGGTFTVTNVGSLGSIMGTPIINQPQVGILATGVIKKRPVVIEGGVMGDTIGVRHMMFISLSYDHRIVDGAMGSSFLQKYIDVLESFDPDEELQ